MIDGYRRNGLLLSLPWDAAFMLVSHGGVGELDHMGDSESGFGVSIPPSSVGVCRPGEHPEIVVEPGGFLVRRGNEMDEIVEKRVIVLDGLFEEGEHGENHG